MKLRVEVELLVGEKPWGRSTQCVICWCKWSGTDHSDSCTHQGCVNVGLKAWSWIAYLCRLGKSVCWSLSKSPGFDLAGTLSDLLAVPA